MIWTLCGLLGAHLAICLSLGSLAALFGAACCPTARWRIVVVILLSPLWVPMLGARLAWEMWCVAWEARRGP